MVPEPVLASFEGVELPLEGGAAEGPDSIGGFTAPAGAPELVPGPMSELDPVAPMLPDIAGVLEDEPAVAPVLAEAPVVAAIDEPADQSRLARSFGEARM